MTHDVEYVARCVCSQAREKHLRRFQFRRKRGEGQTMTSCAICVAGRSDSRFDRLRLLTADQLTRGDGGLTGNGANKDADFGLPRNESAQRFVAASR